MSASLQPKQFPVQLSQATTESTPLVPGPRSFVDVVSSFPRKVWFGLLGFVAEALEEHGKLYEKNPYGWWL